MSHQSCCVVNCKNTGRKNECKFYKFPVAQWKINQRNKWIAAVRRQNVDGSPWIPKPYDYICSDHFIGGKKSEEESSPSYIPTIFPPIYKSPKVNESLAVNRYKRLMDRRIKEILPSTTHPEPIVIESVEIMTENPPAILTQQKVDQEFPKNVEQKQAWLKFIGKTENDIAKVSYLCSQHFDEQEFDRTSSYKVQLRSNALPTKAVFRSKYSKGTEESIILPATSDGQVLTVEFKDEIDIEECNLDYIKQEIDEKEELTTIKQEIDEETVTTIKQEIDEETVTTIKQEVLTVEQDYTGTDSVYGTQAGCSSSNNNTSSDNFGIVTMKKTNSPSILELKKQVRELATRDKLKSKQIRQLQKTNWTQKRKISQLVSTIKELQRKYSVGQKQVVEILEKFGSNDDLVDQLFDEDGE